MPYSRGAVVTRAVRKFVRLMSTPEGQDIFEAFERQANRAWEAGHRHYGAQRIVEWLRHETAMKDPTSIFKIDNDSAAGLARLYGSKYPNRADFFEKRKPQNGSDPWDEVEFVQP
jgi:hypothetical protein